MPIINGWVYVIVGVALGAGVVALLWLRARSRAEVQAGRRKTFRAMNTELYRRYREGEGEGKGEEGPKCN